MTPTDAPSSNPSSSPSNNPTTSPSKQPSKTPTLSPSNNPTISPSKMPTPYSPPLNVVSDEAAAVMETTALPTTAITVGKYNADNNDEENANSILTLEFLSKYIPFVFGAVICCLCGCIVLF